MPLIVHFITSFLAFSISVIEHIFNFPTERKFIWRERYQHSFFHLCFLFSKYFGLAAHLINITVALSWLSRYSSPPADECRVWLIYQTFVFECLMTVVLLILAAEVYAIYECSKRMLGFLFLITIGRAGVACALSVLALHDTLSFDSRCTPVGGFNNMNMAAFGTVQALGPAILIGAIFVRRIDRWRLGLSTPPIVTIVAQVGVTAVFMISLIIAAVILCALKFREDILIWGIFPTAVTLLSFAGCHLVLRPRVISFTASESNVSHNANGLRAFTNLNDSDWDIHTGFSEVTAISSRS